jgi:hypothetical protein
MNRNFSDTHYTSLPVDDKNEGYTGIELYRTVQAEKWRVARVLFWDASGQFFFETFDADLPLEIFEQIIAEAKATIKTG